MVVAQAQVCFVGKLYPRHWPNFWHSVPTSLPVIAAMKQQLLTSGILQRIEQHILQRLNEGDKLASMTFASLARWSDPPWKADPETLSIILNDLTQPSLVQCEATCSAWHCSLEMGRS
jgi:hypothetical protein